MAQLSLIFMRLKSSSFPVVIYLACFYYSKDVPTKTLSFGLLLSWGCRLPVQKSVFFVGLLKLYFSFTISAYWGAIITLVRKNMLRFYCNPWRWMEFTFKSLKYCLIFCNFSHFACFIFNNCCVLREGPIEITGGEVNNFWCRQSYLCPCIFFSVARIFLRHNRL